MQLLAGSSARDTAIKMALNTIEHQSISTLLQINNILTCQTDCRSFELITS